MDRITGIIVFCLGIFIFWQGRRYPVGTLRAPGPGFFPNVIASVLTILSLFLIFAKRKRHEKKPTPSQTIKRVSLVYSVLLGYFFLLSTLGFLITSFFLLSLLFVLMDAQKWFQAAFLSFVSAGLVFVLFEILLKIPLPRGLFGF